MMRRLFGSCFRVPGDGGGSGSGGDDRLVAPYLAPTTSRKDGGERRTRPPSRNALSAVFMREDEGSRVEQMASSWADQSDENKRMDQGLKPEAVIQNCGASQEATNGIQKVLENADSVRQGSMHSGCLSAIADDGHFMEVLNVEDYETPSRFQHSSSVPDAMSSSKANDEMETPVTLHTTDMEGLRKENNTAASMQNEYHVLDLAKDYEKCGVTTEDFHQPDQPDEDHKGAKNDYLVNTQISMSDECSLFQSSEGSVSSLYKIRDSTNTPSMEKSLTTEASIHATRKKMPKNSDSDMEFPSLAQWLKPPNPKKTFKDEAFTCDRSAKSSDQDRPIIGMVAAHWKDKEPEKSTPKWWDGNGIPNSTNKYKEDQKVSWHAMSFEERLEKALSEEKMLSERNCSSGKTSQFLGVENEESDTAESNRLYATAHA